MPVEWLVPSELVVTAGEQRGNVRSVEMDALRSVDAEQTTDRRQQIDDSSRSVLDMSAFDCPRPIEDPGDSNSTFEIGRFSATKVAVSIIDTKGQWFKIDERKEKAIVIWKMSKKMKTPVQ